MSQERDWKDLFVPDTQIRVKEGGTITASPDFETPQTVEITEVSDMTDKDGDWPQAITFRYVPDSSNKIIETTVDNIYIREAIERGDAEILDT